MTRRSYAGGAAALALSGSTLTSTGLSFTTTGTNTGWPDGSGGKFLIVIDRGTSTEEKILVTSQAAGTFTVASTADRGVDGTSAKSHLVPAVVEHVIGKMDIDEPNQHINDATQDNHTQYAKADGTRFPNSTHDVTARHAYGAALGARPVPVATGAANAAGTGAVPAAGDHVHLAAGTLGYAEVTAAQTGISSETDLTSLAVTVTVVSGRRIMIRAQCGVDNDTNAGQALARIKEGATYLGLFGVITISSSGVEMASGGIVLTPTAGSHTYKLTLAKTSGAGTVTMQASAFNAAYILVQDIGV